MDERRADRRGLRGRRAGQHRHRRSSRPRACATMLAEMRARTDRPFAVNHTRRPFSEEAFAVGLEAQPGGRLAGASASPATLPRAPTTPVRASWPRCTRSSRPCAPSSRAPTSSSRRAARPAASAARWRRWRSSRRSSTPSRPSPCSPPAASPTDAGWPPRSCSARGVNVGTRFLATVEAGCRSATRRGSSPRPRRMRSASIRRTSSRRWGPIPTTRARAAAHGLHPLAAPCRGAPCELVGAVRAGRADELVPFAGRPSG